MLTPEQIKKMLQDPLNADWSKLNPRDIGFSMGKPMTEKEMQAYCQHNGIGQPTIVKKPQNKPGTDASPKNAEK